jgi:hypothetical protein
VAAHGLLRKEEGDALEVQHGEERADGGTQRRSEVTKTIGLFECLYSALGPTASI